MTHQRSSRPARFRSPVAWLLALGSLAIALARPGNADAQGYYYDGAGMVGFPMVDFPMVNFPMVNFGMVDFGMVDFGMVNFPLVSPLGGNQNFYYNANPYAYWDGLAAADSYRAAKYAMSSARFNVEANSMATNATAANLIDRDAYMMFHQRNSSAPRTGDRYNVGTGRSALSGGAVGTMKLAEITTRDGDVLWPLTAPVSGDLFDRRRAANQAVKGLMQSFKRQGKLPVEDVVSTLKVLRDYSNPAAETLRKVQPTDASSFENFIASLDRGLRLLATSPVPDPE